MDNFAIEAPEPRNEPINVRVTETNKNFVEQLAAKHSISESLVVSQIIDQYRQVHSDSNKGKPRRGS